MKNIEIEKLLLPLIPKIEEVCEQHGAPFGKVTGSGALSSAQRRAGCSGRVYVILADDSAGWRSKDNGMGRKILKDAIKDVLASLDVKFDVKIQATYSCLQSSGSMILRRNDDGKVIGAYRQ